MRHTLQLHDRRNRPVTVEIDIRMDTVELRSPNYPSSSTDRQYLTGWLNDPYQAFHADEFVWWDTYPITLTIGTTVIADLTENELASLRAALRAAA